MRLFDWPSDSLRLCRKENRNGTKIVDNTMQCGNYPNYEEEEARTGASEGLTCPDRHAAPLWSNHVTTMYGICYGIV